MNEPIDGNRLGTASKPLLKRDTPLIPGDSVAGLSSVFGI